MSLVLFWVAVLLIAYTYIVFPGIVWLRKIFLTRPYKSAEIFPAVSLIIAAHNEARRIGAKVQNILSLDYPCAQLEVIIASDGSNDDTDAIVRSYSKQGVRLLSLPRVGKAGALNAAVEASNGTILVFSDANSMLEPGAIRALVRPFADPQVGGVAGNQCYVDTNKSGTSAEGERSYWNLDRQLKQSQSQAGSAISATGAIYAIRRSLFRPVPPGVTDDFVTSTSVIAQGYRLVFAPEAIAREPVANTSQAEFHRKVRVITRGLRAVWVMRELLNPFKHGFYAIQLFSHKVMRRLVVFPLLLLVLASPLLWEEGLLYQAAMLAQVAFYGCAVLGIIFAQKRLGRLKLFAIPYFFCMVNAASLIATWNVLRGHRIDRWEPQRAEVM
ncbi:MAG: glycosyltransferase family 2 protein [Chloroflexi bacterium]|nr:glycosyltransferase family 2 protein [Chloroflexota bacterium]